MTEKELRKEFDLFIDHYMVVYFIKSGCIIPEIQRRYIFDFFWKKLSEKEELLKAADEVIVNANYGNMGTVKFQELVNKYNSLKKP